MKKLLSVYLAVYLLSALFVIAETGNVPEEFRQLFAMHQEKGTLLDYKTPLEFKAKGWEELYRDGITKQFKGETVEGLRLEISPAKDYKAKVGTPIALSFRLHNDSDKEVNVTVGGNCKTVHQAGYMLIDPHGIVQSLGCIVNGGPHCFCQQTNATLRAHSSIALDTRTDSDIVTVAIPFEIGKYVIIGTYDMPTKQNPSRRIRSQPIVLEIKENSAKIK